MHDLRTTLKQANYPWVSITLLTGITYFILFVLCYMAAAVTYSIFTDIPADRSRYVSAYYYGIFFCVVPFLVISLFKVSIPVRPLHIFVFHTFAVAFIAEKGIIVMAASWLAHGFPDSWYGWVYPQAGFNLLCEELPFYCGNYKNQYLYAGSVLSYISLYAGALLAGALAARSELRTRRKENLL